MRITIVGTGYVGLVTGACLAGSGNTVTGLDVDREKIDLLDGGGCPIHEPGLEELIGHNLQAGRLRFTTDAASAYRSAEAIFICVGTPTGPDGESDLTALFQVAREIGDTLEAAPGPTGGDLDEPIPPGANEPDSKIIVVKSTVPVGTNERVRRTIAERTGKPFRMASNPEFLKEGAAIADFNKPDRVVVGCEDERTDQQMRELYEPFVRQGNPILVMGIRSAEMVKYAANTMLATKISFINEVAALCEAYGADVDQVRQGMCADSRIGNKFLFPGLGYGGSCFPKDVAACVAMGRSAGTPASLMEAVDLVNQRQRQRFIERIEQHFGGELEGKRIAVWGLAFKPGTDDMREAPAVTITARLLEGGAEVVAFDPAATETARRIFGDRVSFTEEELTALDGAEALVICTDWLEFRHPEFGRMRQRMAEPVIFDGRNLYRPATMRRWGFAYYSIGRPDVRAERASVAGAE